MSPVPQSPNLPSTIKAHTELQHSVRSRLYKVDSQQLHATTYLILTCSETYLLFFLLVGSCVFLVCLTSSVSGPPLIWGVCFSSSSTSSWQEKYLQYILYSLVKLLKVILTISPCSHNCWINKYTALFKHSSVSSLLTITEDQTKTEWFSMSRLDAFQEVVDNLWRVLMPATSSITSTTSASTITNSSPTMIASPMAKPTPFSGVAEECNGFSSAMFTLHWNVTTSLFNGEIKSFVHHLTPLWQGFAVGWNDLGSIQ